MNRTSNKRGLLFHIIRGSFVDGYGVRTTVFLKGCPLKCIWCCNPEGQQGHPEIKSISLKCDGCGRCVKVCPVDAIQLNLKAGDDKLKIDRKLCTGCGKCIEVCYTGALDIFGQYYTVDELFDEVKKDEQYFRASGGGVTIGGGEPTFQPSFTLRFIKKCQQNYIHTALDTCGYITNDEGLQALVKVDLVLYDIKGMDPTEHKKNTGVSNELILKNLKRRDALGKPIIVRVPLIPGYTDSNTNLQATAKFLSSLKSLKRTDILAVHEYGKVKYGQLGREYTLYGGKLISHERLEDIKALFEHYGLKTQLGG